MQDTTQFLKWFQERYPDKTENSPEYQISEIAWTARCSGPLYITDEQLVEHNKIEPGYVSVGILKEKLKDIPDDYTVCYQRIDDVNFHPGSGWMENAYFIRDEMYKMDDNLIWPGDMFVQVFNACVNHQLKIVHLEAHY